MTEENKNPTEQEQLDALLEKYESEKKKFQKKMRERERFTANELFNMKNSIEGLRMSPTGEVQKTSGIGDLKGEQYADFNTKLGRNLQIIKNELTVVKGVTPSLSDEDMKEYKEYQKKIEKLEEKNINKSKITGSHKNLATVEKIRLSGNLEIFETEKKKVDKKYKEVLDKVDANKKEANKIFDKPLCKCDFDMILESEIPPEVSPNERQMIYPMVKNDLVEDEVEPEEEPEEKKSSKKSKK